MNYKENIINIKKLKVLHVDQQGRELVCEYDSGDLLTLDLDYLHVNDRDSVVEGDIILEEEKYVTSRQGQKVRQWVYNLSVNNNNKEQKGKGEE